MADAVDLFSYQPSNQALLGKIVSNSEPTNDTKKHYFRNRHFDVSCSYWVGFIDISRLTSST